MLIRIIKPDVMKAGDIIDVPQDLAIILINAGLAEKVSETPVPKERKNAKKDTSTTN